MLDRIEEKQVMANSSAWLDGLIRKHARVDSVSVFFPEISFFQRIPRPYELSTIGTVDQPNWKLNIRNSNLGCHFVSGNPNRMLENIIKFTNAYDKLLGRVTNEYWIVRSEPKVMKN